MSGGLWLHHHTWKGNPMAHLVSSDRERLERVGLSLGLHPARLQYRPLREPSLESTIERLTKCRRGCPVTAKNGHGR